MKMGPEKVVLRERLRPSATPLPLSITVRGVEEKKFFSCWGPQFFSKKGKRGLGKTQTNAITQ